MHADSRVMTVYIPRLAALLGGALELEGVHRLRRVLFGVHPVSAGLGCLLLIVLGMSGAIALSYALIYIFHALHSAPLGYWLPWAVYLTYMTILAERERRAARTARPDMSTDPEEL